MIIFLFLIVFILLGIPMAYSFGLAGITYLLLNAQPVDLLPQAAFGSIDTFTTLSLPFFMLAGDIMKHGGVSKRLVKLAKIFFKRSKAAMGNITTLACAFFGAISGSSAATVAAIGGIMVPEMRKSGYGRVYSTSVICATGFLGIMIPPSVPIVIYGVAANVSVGKLFMAMIVPGIMLTAAFILTNMVLVKRPGNFVSFDSQNRIVETAEIGDFSEYEAVAQEAADELPNGKVLLDAIPAVLMPVIIMGGIYGGIFTATEAAAVSCVYGLIVSMFIYKEIKIRDIPQIALESGVTAIKILLIMSLAGFFGKIMALTGIPQILAETMIGMTDSKYVLMLLLNLVLLVCGMLMETGTAIILVTPILLPIAVKIGLDPIHFGVITNMNLAIGLITPPMALNLFVGSQVGKVPIAKLIKPILPWLIISLCMLALVVMFPQLSLIFIK